MVMMKILIRGYQQNPFYPVPKKTQLRIALIPSVMAISRLPRGLSASLLFFTGTNDPRPPSKGTLPPSFLCVGRKLPFSFRLRANACNVSRPLVITVYLFIKCKVMPVCWFILFKLLRQRPSSSVGSSCSLIWCHPMA